MDNKNIFLISGLSGAGKSTALQVMQDLGFFTADGIAPSLIYDFYRTLQKPQMQEFSGLAIGLDVWRGANFEDIQVSLKDLKTKNIASKIIFLEANEEVIIKRYATTRRPHPYMRGQFSLTEAIKKEIHENKNIRQIADLIIDTSNLTLHDLRRELQNHFGLTIPNKHSMQIELISFGYKYGLPKQADIIFDLRFLPNPFFIPELKELTGLDRQVADFVINESKDFSQHLLSFLYYMLPFYQTEGRYKLCLALGCTGGQHRSVAVVEHLYQELKQHGYSVIKYHKELSQNNA